MITLVIINISHHGREVPSSPGVTQGRVVKTRQVPGETTKDIFSIFHRTFEHAVRVRIEAVQIQVDFLWEITISFLGLNLSYVRFCS